ncbi:sensor histidine kinase [Pedobacter rhodius]|uniref:histidine kinase n=1 Tax=Pedobacter rhodius TaxID=3004098 RepID=A0ABT4KW89_9SPHI|nr:HAMP domain-containing sensor histidine kinase [Pedobacter sp. SJ11]MCZ4223182.1 HAMP domain-containing sensor histidine kinase [Pedobacter sp. SJ11]
MKLADRYNRVNLITALIVLLITGIIYYVVIHFIFTEKLDRDLTVEEDEIKQYVATYQKLPLPASFLDQQVQYKLLNRDDKESRFFKNTTYYNSKEKESEPGRSLITTLVQGNNLYEVTITKSRLEADDLVQIILLITLGVTCLLLLSLILINRFVLKRLWMPFYAILEQMKAFNLVKMSEIKLNSTDVDEFKELNTSAVQMALRVRQDYKELKNFTDNASHEMMTPLAVINSKLDTLLQAGPITERQGVLMEDIYNAINRLTKLNQSLLLLTKIENNLISDVQLVDFREVITEKCRQFQEILKKENLSLNINLKPCEIEMSRYLADILLNNLLGNAVKYNHTKGFITINLDNDFIEIINSGKNFSLTDQHFDRFFKSASSEGMGLGLAIIKQICTLYNFSVTYSFFQENHCFKVLFKN